MKISVWERDKWIDLIENSFAVFLEDVVYSEKPFKFTDCTDEEIEEYVHYLYDESCCLDDGEYYRWYCEADKPNVVYIFEDMVCLDLNNALHCAEKLVEKYRKYLTDLKG